MVRFFIYNLLRFYGCKMLILVNRTLVIFIRVQNIYSKMLGYKTKEMLLIRKSYLVFSMNMPYEFFTISFFITNHPMLHHSFISSMRVMVSVTAMNYHGG